MSRPRLNEIEAPSATNRPDGRAGGMAVGVLDVRRVDEEVVSDGQVAGRADQRLRVVVGHLDGEDRRRAGPAGRTAAASERAV